MTFDPNLVMRHKWGGQPVLVTKSGQNRSSDVRDISQRSVDRRRKKKKKKKKKKEIIQMKYTVADCDCVKKKEIIQMKYTVADCDCVRNHTDEIQSRRLRLCKKSYRRNTQLQTATV